MPTSILLAAVLQISQPVGGLVTISVDGDPAYTRQHTVTILARGSGRPQSEAQRSNQVWIANREWDGGYQSMTSEECPAVQAVALSFGELPAIRISPAPLTIPESAYLPPTIKDGFATSLSFRTLTEDGSEGDVQIRGGNAYQAWGHRAVSELIGCWGPLTP